MVKNTCANAGEIGDGASNPGSGRFPKVGNGNALQYSCLENSTDWRATVHQATQGWAGAGTQACAYSCPAFNN